MWALFELLEAALASWGLFTLAYLAWVRYVNTHE